MNQLIDLTPIRKLFYCSPYKVTLATEVQGNSDLLCTVSSRVEANSPGGIADLFPSHILASFMVGFCRDPDA
jgi:hypothetical protein